MGQSVIEVLIAIALLGVMMTASFILISTSFSEGQTSVQRAQADRLLSDGFEAVRQIRDQDFEQLAAGTHGLGQTNGLWSFLGTSDVTDGTFIRTVDISAVNDTERNVTVTVTWLTRTGRMAEISAASRYTAWKTPLIPTAPNCYGATLTGDWSQPVVVGTADIGSGNQGTDIVVDYPYVYVSGTAATSSKDDLFVFDVTDPSAPVLVDSINIGSNGINSLSLSGGMLYAASSNDGKEFIVFDVSNPTNVVELTYANLSGTANGLSVMAKGDTVALGRAQSSNAEIYFYDLSTGTPSLLNTFEINGDVNDFTSSEAYVYAVGTGSNEDMQIFDVTNPLLPTMVTNYDLTDGTEDVSVAYHDPNTLFIGNASDLFMTLDVTDPQNPVPLTSTSTGGEVKDMVCVDNELLFVGTDNSNKEFMILDITNLSAIVEYGSLNFPQVVNGLDFASNMVFSAVRSNDALRIITSSP